MADKTLAGEEFSEAETARRRDAALLRALSTPPKRHAEMKINKTAAKQPRKAASQKPSKG